MSEARTKKALQKAQQLLKAKRYDEAHALLVKINHPKAREWQAKLEARGIGAKAEKSARTDKSRPHWFIPVALAVVVVIVSIAAALVLSANNSAGNEGRAEARLFAVCLDTGARNCSDWRDSIIDANQDVVVTCSNDNPEDDDFAQCLQNSGINFP